MTLLCYYDVNIKDPHTPSVNPPHVALTVADNQSHA